MNFTLVILACCAVAAIGLIIVYLIFGRKDSPFTFDIGGGVPKASGGSDGSAEKTLSSRLIGFAIAVGGMFAVLIGRLWTMQYCYHCSPSWSYFGQKRCGDCY